MKKTVLASIFITLFCVIGAAAQSADSVTNLIKTNKASWGQICYLSGTYLGLVQEDATPEQAITALTKAGIIKSAPPAETAIPLSQTASICARTWNIKGSLFYTLFKSPRYALRQLKADGIIPASADPSKTTTGHEALNIFTTCMEKYGSSESGTEE